MKKMIWFPLYYVDVLVTLKQRTGKSFGAIVRDGLDYLVTEYNLPKEVK